MIEYEQFLFNLKEIRRKIENACVSCDRNPNEVSLLPVTKNWPVLAVEYCRDSGILKVGENRVQEATEKQAKITGIEWELIGHLQSNKVNQVVGCFSRIQTLDSIKIIRKVQAASERLDHKTRVLLQINSGNDPAKFGFSIDEASGALDEVMSSSHLIVDGLMTIAPYAPEDITVARDCFKKLAELKEILEQSHGVFLKELSMGMSDDLSTAIICGSTMIRVGSALFGSRN